MTSQPLPKFPPTPQSNWRVFLIAAITVFIYITVYLLTWQFIGLPGALAALPVVILGWLFRTRGGAIASVGICVINIVLSFFTTGSLEKTFSLGFGYIVVIALGTFTGWLRSYLESIQDRAQALALAEKNLRESNLSLMRERDQLYIRNAALEATVNAIVIANAEGTIEWVNPAFTNLTGYTFEESIGQTTRLLRSGQHEKEFYEKLWTTISSGQVWQGEIINKRKNGELYTEEQAITPVRNTQGEIINYIAIKQDITARKRAEKSLQRQNEYLTSLHQIALDLLSRQEVNMLLQTIAIRAASLVNAAHCYIFLSEGDSLVLRATTEERVDAHNGGLGTREPKPGTGVLGRVWESRQTVIIENYQEWKLRDPIYAAKGLRSIAGTPISSEGAIAGILEVARTNEDKNAFTSDEVGILIHFSQLASLVLDNARLYAEAQHEIKERRRTEDLLLQSESRFRQIIENASDIIYRTDLYGRFTYVNPTGLRLMKFSTHADILGKHYSEIAAVDERHKLKRFYERQFLRKELNTYYEFVAIATDGEKIWIGQNVQIIKEGDQIIGFQAVARNITQIKQIQDALARARDQALEASRLKSQLLAKVSHELRTPLSGILGYAELLNDDTFGKITEEQRVATAQIIDSTNYLNTIINELLDEAQIESKMVTLKSKPVSTSSLLDQVNTKMSVVAQKKGLALKTQIDLEMPQKILGDEIRLQQMLINLIGNAIKFTKEGEVRVRLYRADQHQWAMEVSDTGAGIPDEAKGYIFEAFRQVDGSATREHRGTGLGLSIVKQLTELMNGKISLESKIGEGSIFTITLPLDLP